MKEADFEKDYITIGCWKNRKGLVAGHAYSVVKVVQLSNKKKTKLVQVRNPWGSTEWKGAWGDKSRKWTAKLKEEAGFDKKNDGVFFMSLHAYRKFFGATWINFDTSDWSRTSFLMLDDQTTNTGPNQGTTDLCGTGCYRHEFTLTSSVK